MIWYISNRGSPLLDPEHVGVRDIPEILDDSFHDNGVVVFGGVVDYTSSIGRIYSSHEGRNHRSQAELFAKGVGRKSQVVHSIE